MRADKRAAHKADKKPAGRHRQGVVGYSKKSALLEEAITHMNAGKYGRSSATLKELLALDPQNAEARRLFATLHLRLGSLVTAREAFESLATEAIGRQDYWLAESLLQEYLAAGPRCVPFLELLAHVYEEKGDAIAAVAELGKAIEILFEDPDPDNPKKPSELYAKIRELAPVSPTAFRFASSFDIQTGEFRIPDKVKSDSSPSEDQHGQTATPSLQTAAEAADQVRPWEQLDDLAGSDPVSPVPATDDVHSGTFVIPGSETDTSHGVQDSGDAGSAFEVPSPDAAPDSGESVVTIPDAPAFVQETTTHQELTFPVEETSPPLYVYGSEQPASVPSRMPWEHVADPSLQIVEPDPALTPQAESVAEAISTETMSFRQPEDVPVAPSLPSSLASGETEPEKPVHDPIPPAFEETTTISMSSVEPSTPSEAIHYQPFASVEAPVDPRGEPQHTLDPVAEIATPVAEPSPAPVATEPASFSWKEIFDSAWKFTVGTTAPGPSVPTRKQDSAGQYEIEAQDEAAISALEPFRTTDHPTQDTVSIAKAQSVLPESTTVADPTPAFSSQPVSSPSGVEEQFETPPPVCESPLEQQTDTVLSRSTAIADPVAPVVIDQSPVIEAPTVQEPPTPTLRPIAIEVPPAPKVDEPQAHWDTGEVAIQSHPPLPPSKSSPEPSSDLRKRWEPAVEDLAPVLPVEELPAAPIDTRPEWEKASEWIRLDQPAATAAETAWQQPVVDSHDTIEEPTPSPASSAVEVLFGSAGANETVVGTSDEPVAPRPRRRFAARVARIRVGIISIILSGFSTTRAFVLMCVTLLALSTVIAVMAVGITALTWILMEEPPTSHYQSLTIGPQRMMIDSRKNGFLLLIGFDAPSGTDAVQAGYERKPADGDLSAAQVCMAGRDANGVTGTGASSNVTDGWFRGSDPVGQIREQPETLRSMLAQESSSITRYQQWLTMPFEDWGFGKILSPDCPRILLAHRLYLLEGFHQDTASGMSRLEKDMEAWRAALGQSKTLMIKMLAVTAVQDDVALASGLLSRPDTDGGTVSRLAKVVHPLDQMELSVRWPMQSYFAWATSNVAAELKKDRTGERPLHVSLAAAMPLPVQRWANAYAEYYEAANRAMAEGRYVNLPKPSQFVRTSGSNPFDYLVNPLEHIIGIEPLPSWDPYVGRMVSADAQLRLASLQAWVRRGPQDSDVLTRLAKAGQAYYDPFTGLPMLVNQRKRLLYSVGPDGKDQEGDLRFDVVVTIPVVSSAIDPKRTSK